MQSNAGQSSTFMLIMNVTNTITHLLLGGIALSAITFASFFPEQNNLSTHIYLCVTGYVIMMAQAILIFSPHNGWSLSLSDRDKKVYHWVMQVIGATLAITGSSIRISNIDNNFQNAHGICGLIAMIFTVVSLIGGVINLNMKRTVITNLLHSATGSLTLVFAFTCLCFGFNKNVFVLVRGQTTSDLLIGLTLFALMATLLTASISNGKRLLRR